MVTDIGAGVTESAVISLGGMSSYRSVKVGGNDMDNSIVRYVRKHYQLLISPDVARRVKERIGTAVTVSEPRELKVRGSDLSTRLPRVIRVNSNDIASAVEREAKSIVETIVSVFQDTPPELTADIIEKGVILTGGVANLKGIAKVVEREINVPVYIADDPEHAVIRGIGRSIQTGHLNFHRRSVLLK